MGSVPQAFANALHISMHRRDLSLKLQYALETRPELAVVRGGERRGNTLLARRDRRGRYGGVLAELGAREGVEDRQRWTQPHVGCGYRRRRRH